MQANEPRPGERNQLESFPASDLPPWTRTHPAPVDASNLLHRTRKVRTVWNHALEEAAQSADRSHLGLSTRIRSLTHAEAR
jgi:hypothetical protein